MTDLLMVIAGFTVVLGILAQLLRGGRELKRWQEMRQEPLTEGVWMVLDRKWVKK